MNLIWRNIVQFISGRFNLQEGKTNEQEIVDSVRKNVEFKGANLWALIFAIFIASIGLNVNSTAVVIGAMLISPIMGPVMGIGLGIGINNLALVKKGVYNLLVATIIGIVTSSVYFFITPLHEAQSELLARTSPSVWDVFIAFFGGMAGMVAASQKEKNNVVPGVAIATALIPPLCTAGFGIATGNWLYFLGAIYLYFINSLFIAIATYLVAVYLKMRRLHFEDPQTEKRVKHYMIAIVIITIVPSIFMAYRIVGKSIFETNSRKFVEEQFNFKNTQVVSRSYHYDSPAQTIDVLLIGDLLDKKTIAALNAKLSQYGLAGVKLNIRQGLNARQQIDLSQIRASILEDVYTKARKTDTVRVASAKPLNADTAVFKELKILYPGIRSFGITNMAIHTAGKDMADTVSVAVLHFEKLPKISDRGKLESWLRQRYNTPALQLVFN